MNSFYCSVIVLFHPQSYNAPGPSASMTPEVIEKERLATLQSNMHQVDLVLRAFVGAT